MTGRTLIVTGANSGIGYEAARYLCEGGNDVILACRNEERGKEALNKIKSQNPNALVTFMQLDLASVESIKKFAEEFKTSGKKLHGLVNNAGVTQAFKDTTKQFTTDGYELTMGTNHLGPFLLTHLLLDDLKKAAEDGGDVRIVNIASSLHNPATMKRMAKDVRDLDIEDLMYDKAGTFNGLQAYKDSKLADIMFTYELARRLEGTGVTVNALNPGFIPATGLNRNTSRGQQFFLKYILGGILRPIVKFPKTVKHGADCLCDLIAGETVKGVTGKYFDETKEGESSAESKDEEKQKRLWEVSGGLLKMEGFEPVELKKPEEPPVEEPAAETKAEEAPADGETKEETKETAEEKKEEGETTKEDEDSKPKEDSKPSEEVKESEEKSSEDKKEEK